MWGPSYIHSLLGIFYAKKKSLTMSWFVCSVFLYVQNLAHSEFTGLKQKRLESHWFLIPIVFDSSRCQNLIHKFKYFRALFRYLARFWFISACKYICFSEQDGKSIGSFSDHVKKWQDKATVSLFRMAVVVKFVH